MRIVPSRCNEMLHWRQTKLRSHTIPPNASKTCHGFVNDLSKICLRELTSSLTVSLTLLWPMNSRSRCARSFNSKGELSSSWLLWGTEPPGVRMGH